MVAIRVGLQGGVNLVAYVQNSPLANVDPLGLDLYKPGPPPIGATPAGCSAGEWQLVDHGARSKVPIKLGVGADLERRVDASWERTSWDSRNGQRGAARGMFLSVDAGRNEESDHVVGNVEANDQLLFADV